MPTIAEAIGEKWKKPGNKSGTPLRILWSKEVAEHYGEKVFSFTQKQEAQLKKFAKLCPPEKEEEVLSYLIREWIQFTKEAKAKAGAFNLPSMPQTGFLLKYAQAGIAMWNENLQTIATKPAPNPQKGLAKKTGPAKVQEMKDESKASFEEVQDILFGDGK